MRRGLSLDGPRRVTRTVIAVVATLLLLLSAGPAIAAVDLPTVAREAPGVEVVLPDTPVGPVVPESGSWSAPRANSGSWSAPRANSGSWSGPRPSSGSWS